MKKQIKTGAVVLGAAALFAVGGMSSAVADKLITGDDIAKNTIEARNLDKASVHKSELAKNSVGKSELQGDLGEQGPQGPQGPQGEPGDPASDVKGSLAASETSDAKTITNVGGSFGKFTGDVRATLLDTVTLPAGQYLLTADGFFHSTEAVSGDTRMQLALRVDDGTDWGQDLGTCFTGATSPLADREATCQTTRSVTLDEETDVQVYGFGYADDQGSADSGKFQGTSYVNALKVG